MKSVRESLNGSDSAFKENDQFNYLWMVKFFSAYTASIHEAARGNPASTSVTNTDDSLDISSIKSTFSLEEFNYIMQCCTSFNEDHKMASLEIALGALKEMASKKAKKKEITFFFLNETHL
jgi:hypothetical protein